MEIKKLIPEQVANMEARLKELESKAEQAKEELEKMGVRSSQFNKIIEEMQELRGTLRMATVISEYDESKIDIGTRFQASLDFGDGKAITDKYILVDELHTLEIEGFTSVQASSPLGKSVFHKGVNEEFSYTIPRGTLVNGIIEEILPKMVMTEKQKTK